MFIYGLRSSKLGELNLKGEPCRQCGYQGGQKVSVGGRYIHAFWIPVIPAGRKVEAHCPNCGQQLKKSAFPPGLRAAYEQQKKSLKRPLWHFISPIVAGLAFSALLIFVVSVFMTPGDPRGDLLEADFDRISLSPTMKSDSISFKIKSELDTYVGGGIDASKNAYYSTVSGEKILVLVKFPELKEIQKEERPKVMGYINKVLKDSPGVSEKERFIGVHGKYNFMMVKTPAGFDNGRVAGRTPLYEFYPSESTP